MKFLKSFNESYSESVERYEEVFDRVKDCFRDFEDEGWCWTEISSYVPGDPYARLFSYLPLPHFKFIMKKKDEEKIYYDPYNRKKFNFEGTIDTNAEITWKHRTTTWARNYSSAEYKDFIVAIRRLHDEIDMGFRFSYNNTFGEERIIIQGRIH